MEFTDPRAGVIAGNLKELQTVSFSPDISRNVAKRKNAFENTWRSLAKVGKKKG